MHPRQTQAAFDKFAEPIGLALKAYPRPIRWDTLYSVESFADRFRHAVRGALKNGYKNSYVDPQLLREYGSKLSIAPRDGYVLIGPRESLKDKPLDYWPSDVPEVNVNILDDDCIHALCYMVQYQCFTPSVIFTVSPLTPVEVTRLETKYKVTLTPVPGKDDTYTLL